MYLIFNFLYSSKSFRYTSLIPYDYYGDCKSGIFGNRDCSVRRTTMSDDCVWGLKNPEHLPFMEPHCILKKHKEPSLGIDLG